MSKKTKEEHLEDLLNEINADRQATVDLLMDLSNLIRNTQNPNSKLQAYQDTGTVAGKYLEVLQKINEQKNKVLSMIKNTKETPEDLSMAFLGASPKSMDKLYKKLEEE
jgi:hypothetical protein